MNSLDNPEELFAWLKTYQPDTKYSQIVWEGLANKYYYMIDSNETYTHELKANLLKPIIELADKYQSKVPSEKYQQGWHFIQTQIQGQDLTSEQIQNIAYEFSRTTSTKNQTTD